MNKTSSYKSLKFLDEEGQVFGPKLSMKNNICKKKTYIEEIDVSEEF